MKRVGLILTLTVVLSAMTPVFYAGSATALAQSGASGLDQTVPFTDRVPWLIYVVLTSSSVALAWILFSLARAKMREPRGDEEKRSD